MTHTKIFLAASALVWLTACQTTPPRNLALEEARQTYNQASTNIDVTRVASAELERAKASLNQAEQAWSDKKDRTETDHLAYIAKQHSQVAINLGMQRAADEMVTAAGPEREKAQIEAKSRDVQVALAQQAQAAQATAQSATQRADQLEKELAELSAQQTNRGLVVVLQDVIFDVGQATLKPGAETKLQRMAAALQQNPQRHILVEGFTDSTGSAASNRELSERRAMAVRDALTAMGISRDRIETRGYGPDRPVASNQTDAGRQQNRRVEIVFSNPDGRFQAP